MKKISKLSMSNRKNLKELLINKKKYTDNIDIEVIHKEINNNEHIEEKVKEVTDELIYNIISKEDAIKRGHPEWAGMKEVILGGGEIKVYALILVSVMICKLIRIIDGDSMCAFYADLVDSL